MKAVLLELRNSALHYTTLQPATCNCALLPLRLVLSSRLTRVLCSCVCVCPGCAAPHGKKIMAKLQKRVPELASQLYSNEPVDDDDVGVGVGGGGPGGSGGGGPAGSGNIYLQADRPR